MTINGTFPAAQGNRHEQHQPKSTRGAARGVKGKMTSCDSIKTQMLRVHAEQLRRSERGAAALENLCAFFREGGLGLDCRNQEAVAALIHAAFNNPWDLPAELTAKARRTHCTAGGAQ